jgi:UPF0755 protein
MRLMARVRGSFPVGGPPLATAPIPRSVRRSVRHCVPSGVVPVEVSGQRLPAPPDMSRRRPARPSRGARLLLPLLSAALLSACGDDTPRRVVIPSGSSFRAAADSLAHRGVIGSPTAFRIYARLTSSDRSIQAGTYEFRSSQSWGEILDALASGRGLAHTFTIPEGFALASIVGVVAKSLAIAPESVEVATRDTAFLRRLDIPTETLEGYLFPDTYTFPSGSSAREVVEAMVERFEQAWKPAWTAQLDSLALSRHDVVTMASIVEKEARVAEERPVISAVYYNRLRVGMLLQADPTVQYALGRHVERVLYRDLETDSKYNTYKYPGLPPGPIASPGAASLEAAVYPAKVPYLFFVAHPDGHHEFRRTFREHSQAIREIRQKKPSGKQR